MKMKLTLFKKGCSSETLVLNTCKKGTRGSQQCHVTDDLYSQQAVSVALNGTCSTLTVSGMLWDFKDLGTNPLSQSSAESLHGFGLFGE